MLGISSAADLPTTASFSGASTVVPPQTPPTQGSPSPHTSTTTTTPGSTSTAPLILGRRMPPQNMPKLRKMSPLGSPSANPALSSGRKGRPGTRASGPPTPLGDALGCNEEMSDNDGGNEEEEGQCSAPFCRQPVAEQISWVQCDHCQEWFHCLCVGLTKEYADKIDSYNCKSCKAVGVASGGGASQRKGVVVRAERTRVAASQVRGGIASPGNATGISNSSSPSATGAIQNHPNSRTLEGASTIL